MRYSSAAEDDAHIARDEPAWADWVPPADLLGRIRLERGLLAGGDPALVNALPLRQWERWAAQDLSLGNRGTPMSLRFELRLHRAPIPRSELDGWSERAGYREGRRPTASAHDVVPPLFVTMAKGQVAVSGSGVLPLDPSALQGCSGEPGR